MKKFTIVNASEPLIHILGWVFLFGSPLLLMDRNSGLNWVAFFRQLNGPLGMCIVFYVNYLYLVPKFYLHHKQKEFALINIVFCVLVCIGMTYWVHLTHQILGSSKEPFIMRRGFIPPPKWFFFLRDFIMQIFIIILAATLRMSKEWSRSEKARREAELGKTEAELKNLRNQINPHFLLNTLNNIYALIMFNTDKAQEAVQDLSKLLRHVLYDNQQEFVPLTNEIEFLNNYIDLMRIRLSTSVDIQFNTNLPKNQSILIAPLLYISLIENAFKHGVRTTEPSFIHINIDMPTNSTLRFSIENTNFPKNETDKSGSGIGLEQVQKRLDIIYPNRYRWQKGVNTQKDTYSSLLEIDIDSKKRIE